MKIEYIDIQNFRRLKSVRFNLSDKTTLFAGTNNSGKTSAMQALIKFLSKNKGDNQFTIQDFTLSSLKKIDEIGNRWESIYNDKSKNFAHENADEDIFETENWDSLIPKMDIWLNVTEDEIHLVEPFIPDLNWDEKRNLGIRILLDPISNLKAMFLDYREVVKKREKTIELSQNASYKMWPNSLYDFLKGKSISKLNTYFEIKLYVLDDTKFEVGKTDKGILITQTTPRELENIPRQNLDSIIKVDIIEAHRGLDDNISNDVMSNLLHNYYETHFNMEDSLDSEELKIKSQQQEADSKLDLKLKKNFSKPLKELKLLGYPSFLDPSLNISTKTNTSDLIQRGTQLSTEIEKDSNYQLPESYNGLGYQNLTTMTFKMMAYRDNWMQVGKLRTKNETENKEFQKLHIVLIEEPEAHLHVQVQQVFIKNAYRTLRNHFRLKGFNNAKSYKNLLELIGDSISNHNDLEKALESKIINEDRAKKALEKEIAMEDVNEIIEKSFKEEFEDFISEYDLSAFEDSDEYNTQLILSTHSSDIVAGTDFSNLRYFKKVLDGEYAISLVVNMIEFFNNNDTDTEKFVKRYIRATHCDLFFADAVILVEGKAETMLLPHFIQKDFKILNSSYISILEIGGRHSHRFKDLIKILDIPCLVITDLDPGEKQGRHKKMKPVMLDECVTTNDTLRLWLKEAKSGEYPTIQEMLEMEESGKIIGNKNIRFAYQGTIKKQDGEDYIGSTFEDTLICTNIEIFKEISDEQYDRLFPKDKEQFKAINFEKQSEFYDSVYDLVHGKIIETNDRKKKRTRGLDKIEFVFGLFLLDKFESISTPDYIKEGLSWLETILFSRDLKA